jgi:hypothetical protein
MHAQDCKQPVIAVGTPTSVKVYLPLRLYKQSNGEYFGDKTGMYITVDEKVAGQDGPYVSLESFGSLDQTRQLLNRLLPQEKVNHMLERCWQQEGERADIIVLARVIDYAKARLKAA